MWYDESVIYQIYPLGYVGAPEYNDGKVEHRILRVVDHISHFKKLGVNCVYFCPVFESVRHGYDTKDYSKIDSRLGTNEDFKRVCEELHQNNIKIIIDGVFNHVGRDFFAFKDVQLNKSNSVYKDWFYINFDGNSKFDDGFYYEGWEGFYELVKLNLDNPAVKDYLFNCIKGWFKEFDIDGIRLDVAYMLNKTFMKELRILVDEIKPDAFLFGEIIHGDYNNIMNNDMLHSVTNYECYKGIYSSFNELNMFEISYSLNRQFGSESWCLYTGKNLVSFVDNHDVSRIASAIKNEKHLKLVFGLLFTMPGIPCIYYGSEWGEKALKQPELDILLRPEVNEPKFNELSKFISVLASLRVNNKTLAYGNLKNLVVTNGQYVFERRLEEKRIVVIINAMSDSFSYNLGITEGVDLLTDKKISIQKGVIELPEYSIKIIEC